MNMPSFVSNADCTLRRRELARRLRRQGIRDDRVLQAIETVPRELFLPEDEQHLAYEDRALPIKCEQTISQPYIVALMTEALELTGDERVLEIGTGSGYQTAILAALAAEIDSLERHAELSAGAAAALAKLDTQHVQLHVGDGALGWPGAAPFDRILVTAAAYELPPALWDQLREGGLLVAPLGDDNSQLLEAWRKVNSQPEKRILCACRFVPLVTE